MRSFARFGVVSLAVIALIALVMSMVWSDGRSRSAVYASAGLAFVTQMFSFAIARSGAPANMMAGWGLGILLRFVVLVGWGLAAPRAFGFPLMPALVALAACFFVTSVVEPIFLKA